MFTILGEQIPGKLGDSPAQPAQLMLPSYAVAR